MKKQYMFDYHGEFGFLNRWFIEAENLEEAERIAREKAKWFRGALVEGSVKEAATKTAAKDNTDALFEQHAMSFVGGCE